MRAPDALAPALGLSKLRQPRGLPKRTAARASGPCTQGPAGTVLIREWQGTSHEVTVLEHGVTYRGKRYRSLSEVARSITRSRWSGPLFVGLRAQAQEVLEIRSKAGAILALPRARFDGTSRSTDGRPDRGAPQVGCALLICHRGLYWR